MPETLPTIDFATFILSLSHSALMHLGEAPHPDTNKVEANLPLAKQNIDLLGLMEEKTKGNATHSSPVVTPKRTNRNGADNNKAFRWLMMASSD